MGALSPRIYLTGRVRVEADGTLLDEGHFGGRQGRFVFAYLAAEHRRPVPRDELAEALWQETPPRSWPVALSAVVSNLRSLLGRAGLPRADVIANAFGCYQFCLPAGAWIDLDAAAHAVDAAEGALRMGDPGRAWGWAGAATAIARRPFLPGETGAWVERQRAELRGLLLRGLDCFAEILVWHGEPALAESAAEEALALEPYRETGYQRLMRVHAAAGNRAEAVRAYERCRRLLADDLGLDPSPETEAVYLEILRC